MKNLLKKNKERDTSPNKLIEAVNDYCRFSRLQVCQKNGTD